MTAECQRESEEMRRPGFTRRYFCPQLAERGTFETPFWGPQACINRSQAVFRMPEDKQAVRCIWPGWDDKPSAWIHHDLAWHKPTLSDDSAVTACQFSRSIVRAGLPRPVKLANEAGVPLAMAHLKGIESLPPLQPWGRAPLVSAPRSHPYTIVSLLYQPPRANWHVAHETAPCVAAQ